MKSRNVDSTALDDQTKTQTAPERETKGDRADGAAEGSDLDDLVDYKPVPRRRMVSISIQYRQIGRGRPLPYILDEGGEE